MPKKKKIFILDTNVILHDSTCIYNFEEHDIIIPIPVLEELDQFKKGTQIINYHAREFVRELDRLSGGGSRLFNGSMALGEGKGVLAIRLDKEMHPDLKFIFSNPEKKDHRIINIAYHIMQKSRSHPVVIVSKDVNLRMKARSIRLMAEDYTTDYVRDPAHPYSGCHYEENLPSEIIAKLYGHEGQLTEQEYSPTPALLPNQYLVLRNGKKSALATYGPGPDGTNGYVIRRVTKESVYGITPRNVEQTFAIHALLNPEVKLVTISGKAGTGKTLLALAAALESRSAYHQILLTRPLIPLSNRDIGFLPGDIASKIKPFMQPLYDNLGVIRGQFSEKHEMFRRLQDMLEENKLAIEPLAYIRGRSLVKMFMIVDEAQNLTPHEVKTIITRAGEGTKIVFTGDINQIDHPYLGIHSNGLSTLIDKMAGQRLYAHIDLRKGERSELAELASNIL
ncbi:MAG: PhoH family protein [Desulfoprunum sp.]|uniref:PhoH family protein n=1 Tax=Desulfoprunum sp. TaxID=2020866 RepID=UPI00052D2D0D|nr:phosphate starvation protein PhoH [Desulfobulbus sp. Tol-SR]